MRNTRRILALVLCAALLLSLVSFGAAEGDKPSVSIALALSTNVLDYETNAYTLALEAEFDVDVEVQPMEDIGQKLPILVNSGSELADMLCTSLDNTVVWSWAQQGVLVPLTEYWQNPEMTTHLYNRVADLGCDPALVDQMLGNVTMPDGEIYTLPSYDQNLWNLMPYRMRLNMAWLEQAGLAVPDTLDELRDLLIYFRDNDMNGNGDASDEIPMTGAYGMYGGNLEAWLLGAFIHANPSTNCINVEDGKVVPAYTQDAFREGLAYLHEMYEEGLIDPLAFTQDQAMLRATINGEVELAGMVCSGSDSNFTIEQTKADYAIIGPVAGPEGVRLSPTVAPTVTNRVFITSDAEDPALCFAMAEINYDTEWRARFRNGIEGENWSRDPEVMRQYKLRFSYGDYDKAQNVLLENIWGKPSNNIWNAECMPFFATQEGIINQITSFKLADLSPEELEAIDPQERHYDLYVGCQPEELLGTLVYTTEEIETLTEVKAAIDSYVGESIMAFIVGTKSLDDWDTFQSELAAMGLENYVTVMQAAYDRKA